MSSDDAARAVRVESIRAVYRHLPLTLGVSAVNVLIVAASLAPRVAHARLAAWLAAFALMAALRTLVWSRFMRLADAAMAAPRWTAAALAGALSSGLIWGAVSLWLMPTAPPYPLFVAFVIGGMSAGAVTVNATHLLMVVAFILPAVLPLAVRLALDGGRLGLAMALMTVLYAVALVVTARRYAEAFADSVRARFALAERTAELAAANARLRAEVAERETAEAALRQSQKMEAIGSLTAGVAHDVNNVLMVVRGAAEVLKRRLSHAPGHLREITAILRASERGAALTRRLLAFARQEALRPDVVDVNALLRSVSGLLGATLGESILIALDLAATLPPVFIDRSGLDHVVINLAINARDAMPAGGTLTFRTACTDIAPGDAELAAGSYVTLDVCDTGTGMTEKVRARAFDPFFTTKPAGQGSGLGLSQVYGLLRQSGGTARISSVPGGGTTVRLFLPVARPDQAPREKPPEPLEATAGEPAAPHHLVLLEDEDLVREVVAEMLAGAGYRVSAFAQAADALGRIEADPSVAMLITDLGLPDLDGEEVGRRARRMRPGLPVLFITGYNEAGRLDGERWQLRKPFGEAELLEAAAGALSQAAPAP
jgi:signal transduction histidine kinase